MIAERVNMTSQHNNFNQNHSKKKKKMASSSTNGNVKIIASDTQFQPALDEAGTKLVVVDFHATWCGPCKRIAPVFVQYSLKYTNVVFLKVDVDQCTTTSEKYGVTAMPTFIFIKLKQKVDQLRGADPNLLLEKIKKNASDASEDEDDSGQEEVRGFADLVNFLNSTGCNCLNESDEHNFKNVFKNDENYLESDCDEQLLLTIEFTQPVKVHSLKFKAPENGHAPKLLKVFANQPSAMSFDQAEQAESLQKLELTPDDIKGEKVINLRFVKFQNVNNLVLFFINNQGDEETTIINYLKIIGAPIDSTNMNDFKRIAGKAGESH